MIKLMEIFEFNFNSSGIKTVTACSIVSISRMNTNSFSANASVGASAAQIIAFFLFCCFC